MGLEWALGHVSSPGPMCTSWNGVVTDPWFRGKTTLSYMQAHWVVTHEKAVIRGKTRPKKKSRHVSAEVRIPKSRCLSRTLKRLCCRLYLSQKS